jgi:hypothetical protein
LANGLTTPEDITTNGTDVWIVDDGANKVFRYSAAASRTSGNQSAISSFALNSANLDAKGIVTDGTSLWVVNDSTTDKVFKYSLSGTLLGSWTIDANNSSPTGITIDPTNPNDIWIVDAAKDSVYRYNGAASRLTGSQTAASAFQLASGNTNPQGIADPPAGLGASASSELVQTIAPTASSKIQVRSAVVLESKSETVTRAPGKANGRQHLSINSSVPAVVRAALLSELYGQPEMGLVSKPEPATHFASDADDFFSQLDEACVNSWSRLRG